MPSRVISGSELLRSEKLTETIQMLLAVALFFLLRPHLGTENLSWVCIFGAAPFAVMGFVRYHGMNYSPVSSTMQFISSSAATGSSRISHCRIEFIIM